VCSYLGDGDWIEAKDQSGEGIRLIQTGNIGEGNFLNKAERSHFITEQTFSNLHCEEIFPGDILISRLPEPIGRACIVPDIQQRMITAVDCSIARMNDKHCLKKFFVYFSQSQQYISFIEQHCTGTTRSRISRKKLANVLIPLPPVEEQKRIVGILDSAFEKIDAVKRNAEQNLANAKELFQRILDEEMTPKEGWLTQNIKDLHKTLSPPAKILARKYLTVGQYPIVSQDEKKINGYWDKREDLVHIGSSAVVCFGDHTKTVKYIDFDFVQGADGLKILLPNKEIEPRFFYYGLLNTHFRDLGYARHYKLLKNESLSFPEKLEVQKRIVEILDSAFEKIDAVKRNANTTLQYCLELKQQILSKAFRGEL